MNSFHKEKILEQGSSFVFFLTTTEIFPEKMQVKLKGERHVYLGGKMVSRSQEICFLSFRMSGKVPLLTGVRIESGEKDGKN